MPYPLRKNENYSNLHGINVKLSQYLTPDTEFLNLQNVCFEKVGALQTVPGTVKFNIQGATLPTTGLADFSFDTPIYIATNMNGAFDVSGATYQPILPSVVTGVSFFPTGVIGSTGPFSFFRGSYLFAANGEDFYTLFSRPPAGSTNLNFGVTQSVQYSLPLPDGVTMNPVVTGTSLIGDITVYQAFKRIDSFVGPAMLTQFLGLTNVSRFGVGAAGLDSSYGVSLSLESYGVSYYHQWYSVDAGDILVYGQSGIPTDIPINTAVQVSAFSSYTVTALGFEPIEGQGTFFPIGGNEYSGSLLTYFGNGLNPTTIEVINDRMFFGGFQQSRENLISGRQEISSNDVVWYSLAGQYEIRGNEAFFYVRRGDGDVVTCLKAYLGNLVMFKTNSTSVLSGTERPETFNNTEVTDQYGCLSANGACVWKQNLWFLDKKGIASYNGANTEIVSNKMEEYFLRMNVNAARYWGRVDHIKERNEVWCAIPLDDSTYANIVIFYDYVADAWGTRTISECTALMNTTNTFERTKTFYGDATSNIFQYGESTFTDNFHAFTCVIKSRFIETEMGNTVEKMYRRLYIDALVEPGTTQVIDLNFYANQGVTPAYSTTMAISSFQNRIDFGIPAASVAVEMVFAPGQFLQVNGFTFEYRYQRAVTSG